MDKRDGSGDVDFVVCVKSGNNIISIVFIIMQLRIYNQSYIIIYILNVYASNYANTGTICTTRDVPPCSKPAYENKERCEHFKPPADDDFKMMFPTAYAEVCEEASGELCLYTDVEYKTCDEAKTSQ